MSEKNGISVICSYKPSGFYYDFFAYFVAAAQYKREAKILERRSSTLQG
jgi:hypothetical protein